MQQTIQKLKAKLRTNKEQQPKSLEVQLLECLWRQDASDELQRVLEELSATGQVHEAINARDGEGRTPLMIASALNYRSHVQTLLAYGAGSTINLINSKINPKLSIPGGSALHDAARGGHELVAEDLLMAGANPFLCNAMGRSCMDEAVARGSFNLLRRFEKMSTWRGDVELKVNRWGGLTHEWEAHHLVVLPLIPYMPETQQQCALPPPRLQLWVYKQGALMMPKAKIWLDGASLERTSLIESMLRLHPSLPPFHADNIKIKTSKSDRVQRLVMRTVGASKDGAGALDALAEVLIPGPAPHAMLPSWMQPAMTSAASSPLPPFKSAGDMPPPSFYSVGSPSDMPPPSYYSAGVPSDMPPPSYYSAGVPSYMPSPYPPDPPFYLPYPSAEGPSMLPPGIYGIPYHGALVPGGPSDEAPMCIASQSPTSSSHAGPSRSLSPLAVPLPLGPGPEDDGRDEQPSAGEDTLCVICLTKPREAGFAHAGSLHRCACRDCVKNFRVGAPCPMCRKPIELVLNVYS